MKVVVDKMPSKPIYCLFNEQEEGYCSRCHMKGYKECELEKYGVCERLIEAKDVKLG